ncbi:GNAT family N-acetyltransferase [Phyllobacterium sp. 21LDTY02-6]|uniref:GNAT family N-acetyltransferase n=1 Tax=Phyllobacterium sp. 21LDTY02-6 TaxID=2944903 RepID=UPI0020215564|nr:GNAT family N-acetyltransferase [Phyllobacterium sp. 21LDTY02-6]
MIRKAAEADIAQIAAIGSRAWASSIFSFEEERPGMRTHVEKAFAGFAREYYETVLVAETEQGLAGWGARETRNEYISDLWVEPALHGLGTGTLLLRALKAEIRAAGHRQARISTHARNRRGIALYQREGFVIVEQKLEWSTSLEREIEKVSMIAEPV